MAIPDYDYIIAGAGCAGLSLVLHLLKSEQLRTKKILIIDRDYKLENDRTWCFWEQDPDLFQPIVYREWNKLEVKNDSIIKKLDIVPYTYKMIRGIDFYQYCLKKIDDAPNTTFLHCDIEKICYEDTAVIAGGITYTSRYVFNSTFAIPKLKPTTYWLLQHFKGLVIKTIKPAFSTDTATLMDFTTDQQHGTAFFYVLPLSETEALIEYTLFSNAVLQDHQYDAALTKYITALGIFEYQVISEEKGIIPMTNHKFTKGSGNIVNVGTAGGQTKGSSGYTFRFIQKHSALIVKSLEAGTNPLTVPSCNRRHQFYDSILLNILYNRSLSGDSIFTALFLKNPAAQVLKFLDNETTVYEEFKIITRLPTMPFAKAALQQLMK